MIRQKTLQWLALSAFVLPFSTVYIFTRDPLTWPLFFGDKQVATFDLWSFQHLWSGIIITFIFKKRHNPLLITMTLTYLWEALEWWMESGGLGVVVASWKAGHEHWTNRLIGDPGMMAIGLTLYRQQPKVIYPTICLSIVWLIVNIIAPNCMSVQQSLIKLF